MQVSDPHYLTLMERQSKEGRANKASSPSLSSSHNQILITASLLRPDAQFQVRFPPSPISTLLANRNALGWL